MHPSENQKEKRKAQRGFSLMELLVTVALSVIVISAVYITVVKQEETFALHEKTTDAQQGVRGALALMMKEIRMAGYDPYRSCLPEDAADSNDDPDGFTTATASTMTLTTCTTPATPAYDTITYTRNSSDKTITREITPSGGSSGGAQTLAENVTSLTFTYYDSSGTDITTSATTQAARDTIRRVTISATATVGGNTRTLTSDAYIRNMED